MPVLDEAREGAITAVVDGREGGGELEVRFAHGVPEGGFARHCEFCRLSLGGGEVK